MDLKPDLDSYELPAIGQMRGVSLDTGTEWRDLLELDLRILLRMRAMSASKDDGSVRGLPVYFALAPVADRMLFFPAPDRDYRARVRFYPPAQEV